MKDITYSFLSACSSTLKLKEKRYCINKFNERTTVNEATKDQEKPSFDTVTPQNNISTTRPRRQQKQALDGTQWFIRIGIGLVILLFLIIVFK